MTLANEAAYLYVYSKQLMNLNKRIRRYTKKAVKHKEKHHQANEIEKKIKHQKRWHDAAKKLQDLMKDHNVILAKLNNHQVAFAHSLRKEHKV